MPDPIYPHPEAKILAGSKIGLAHVVDIHDLALQHGRAIAWHAHPGIEILCCVSGVLCYEFENRPSVTLGAGHCLIVPHGVVHRIKDGMDEPNRRICFTLEREPASSARMWLMSGREYRDLYADLVSRSFRSLPFSRNVREKLLRIAAFVDQGEDLSPREKIEARVDVADILLSLAAAPRPTRHKPQVRMMDEAVAYLERHFREKVSVGRLAAFMGYGRSSLFALFRDNTGMTPVEWLTKRRIDEAKRLLRNGEPVARVAELCGYNDVGFFSRTFRRRTGLAPSSFAERNAAKSAEKRRRSTD